MGGSADIPLKTSYFVFVVSITLFSSIIIEARINDAVCVCVFLY